VGRADGSWGGWIREIMVCDEWSEDSCAGIGEGVFGWGGWVAVFGDGGWALDCGAGGRVLER
jgi:hypothetical protein